MTVAVVAEEFAVMCAVMDGGDLARS